MSDEIRKWEKHASRVVSEHRIFKIREDHTTNPRTGSEHKMVVLECPNWVNIIALTPEREVVFVEQYRQGSETVELEIPGGMMDPGETDPVATALRELREERTPFSRPLRVCYGRSRRRRVAARRIACLRLCAGWNSNPYFREGAC